MTKEFIDSIVKQLKEYVDAKLRGWGLSDEEKSLVAFEQNHMPYTQYSGNQSIDHVLFRKFLRLFDPENIRNNLANHKQDKYDEGLKTADKTVVGAINEVKQKALDDYGPYENTTLEAIATMLHDRLTPGKTIGVIEDGYVVEYWWQPNEEAGGKEVLVYYDDAAGVEFSYNFIGERENIYDTPLYEWGNDSGAKVYTKTKNSTSAENGVYRLVDGVLYFIASIDKIIQTEAYAFVKKAAGEGGGGNNPIKPLPSIAIDTELDKDSSNAIANKAVAEKFEEIEGLIGTGGGSVDVTMGETFTTNMAVGGIDSGTQIKSTDTIKTIIKNMLLKLKEAVVKSAPYATISPTGGNVEYGTTISNSFTANLVDGKFTQYTNGGTSTQDINMGCSKISAAFQKKVGSGSYTDYTNGTSFKVDETTSIKAIVSHSASTAKPTNSDGSSTLSYAAGSKEATATYTPRLGWFFVTLDAIPTSVTRETFGNYDGLVTGAFNTTQSFNKKVVLLAIPSAYKLSSALSANNEEQTYTESNITIADAGGTGRSYKLYAFEYAAALGVNVTLKITA